MNKHKFAAILNFSVALINLIISIFLAKAYGAIGAALGTAIGNIISIIIINIYYKLSIGLNIKRFWFNIINQIKYYIVPIFLMILIMYFIKIEGIYNVVIFGTLYTIMFAFVSYIFVMNKYEKSIINKILLKVRRCKNEIK